MPKRSKERDAAAAEYITRRAKGKEVNLKKFAEELGLSYSMVRRWKSEDRWEEAIPRKRGGQPGNTNAKGNRGGGAPAGNINAEKDGAYSKIFWDKLTQEEWAIVESTPLVGVEALRHEMQVLKYREKKILDAIAKYETAQRDELYLNSVLDMREPGGRGDKKIDGLNQNMGMYSKETPFARILKLQDALNKCQGRITAVANALRQAEEFDRRMELEQERLNIMRMRATGTVEVEDETLHEQGDEPIPEYHGTKGTPTEG